MKILDASAKQDVAYCIPLWLRDEQILLSTQRVKPRIQPGPRTEEPIALVSFGPSLAETWEQIRGFTAVMTCSGAHKFLVDRGIIPTYHIEVDPRPHKVTLMGPPQAGTKYLIASACHPALFKHLEGYDVALWHVFDQGEDAKRILPLGEWAITGGCSVGLRTLTLAAFLGYRNLHVFGMDGCAGPADVSHADAHPNGIKKWSQTEYEGKTYLTTPGMLQSARETWHELDQMPEVTAQFYGEGLVQAMAKSYVRTPLPRSQKPFENTIAFERPKLISEELRELNAQLHRDNPLYGVGGSRHAEVVKQLRAQVTAGGGIESILDYGCGKGMLAKSLPFPIWEYDPAIPEKAALPRPADLVICTDVLEHIEPDRILFVLDDLRRVTRKVGFFTIHMGPAIKTYADGRNTHLLQRDRAWWIGKLKKFFTIGKVTPVGPELHVLVGPKK